MGAALPIIGGVLGVVNAIQGFRAQQAQLAAINQAQQIQQGQSQELANLQAALADPNNPLRRGLRAEAEANIGQSVSTAQGELVSDLASRGLRSPLTLAGPLGALAQRGISAIGDLERRLVNDYFAKRLSLATPGGALIQTGTGIGNVFGGIAGEAGGAVGSLLSLIARLRGGGAGGGFDVNNPWAWLTGQSAALNPALAFGTSPGGGAGGINRPLLI